MSLDDAIKKTKDVKINISNGEEYLINDSQIKAILAMLNKAENYEIPYNEDKLTMAESAIRGMRTQIKLIQNAVKRLKGDCGCRN